MDSRLKKKRIIKILERYQAKLINFYLVNGPSKLRTKLDIQDDDIWEIIFDYLVCEKDVIKLCVRNNPEYIHDVFSEQGPKELRENFAINDRKYDIEWEYVMDYIGVSRGALYDYVNNNIGEFRALIYKGKTGKIRELLCINKEKYDYVWENILDILLGAVSTQMFTYSMFEQGLHIFSNLYNQGRKHRSLKKSLFFTDLREEGV
jgi:hypothetical protein